MVCWDAENCSNLCRRNVLSRARRRRIARGTPFGEER